MVVSGALGIVAAGFVLAFCLAVLPEGIKARHGPLIRKALIWNLRLMVAALVVALMSAVWYEFHPLA